METGIFDMPHEKYLKEPKLSASGLKAISKSPATYIHNIKNPKPSTPAMALGTHVHMGVLEPSRRRDEYVVAPNCDKRTKRGKIEWQAFVDNNVGKTVVSQDEMDTVNGIVDAVKNNVTASRYLKGTVEQSVFWTDILDTPCKARPDVLCDNENCIVDLKTTQDASPDAFQRAIVNFKYHLQAAFYLRGLDVVLPGKYTQFAFVAVETSAPFNVATYIIDQDSITIAEVQILELIETYTHCKTFDTWPGLPDEINTITLPHWYKARFLNENVPF